MEAESAKAKIIAAKEKFGREILVYETSVASSTQIDVTNDEPDKFYEFTSEDYYQIMATKRKVTDKFLKTRKIREAEETAHRSRMTKAVIRVCFPDNYTLEATFHSSETIQSLIDLLTKVVAHPELPFYIYTTPPKKQIKDMSLDFYSAGFIPGAIVYFSYDLLKDDDGVAVAGPFLLDEIMSLKGLELIAEQVDLPQANPESVTSTATPAPAIQHRKPAIDKKSTKPKWFKM